MQRYFGITGNVDELKTCDRGTKIVFFGIDAIIIDYGRKKVKNMTKVFCCE